MKVAPSILSANFANLESEIKKINNSAADYIHIDVMDGHFVPNITIGPAVIKSIKQYSNIPFDVHLMIENPEAFYASYIDAGADILTFHIESTSHPYELIKRIKDKNCMVGLSLKPASDWEMVLPFINDIDLILIMTVEPGFGGQDFMMNQVEKIASLAGIIKEQALDILLSVDGGINAETASISKDAGASMLVSGSFLFKQKDFSAAVMDMKNII